MAEIVVLIEAETGGSGKSEKWGDSNREDTVSSCETLVILITALYNRSQSLLCADEEKPLGNWPELEGLTSRRGRGPFILSFLLQLISKTSRSTCSELYIQK